MHTYDMNLHFNSTMNVLYIQQRVHMYIMYYAASCFFFLFLCCVLIENLNVVECCLAALLLVFLLSCALSFSLTHYFHFAAIGQRVVCFVFVLLPKLAN